MAPYVKHPCYPMFKSLTLHAACLLIALTVVVTASSPAITTVQHKGTPAPYDITPEQISQYKSDGVIIIRGLLQGKELKNAIRAAKRIDRSKSLADRLLYKIMKSYGKVQFQTWRTYPAMEHVAFESAAPTICAKLMGLNANKRPLRLLKDAFLSFGCGDQGCGWHVDDKGFWPCEDGKIGQRDAGINVWITLSPVTKEEGGGLTIVPKSHRLNFAKRARKVIASKGAFSTCLLQTLDPERHEKMESLKSVPDLQPGDAIFHNRYVFHRAEQFVNSKKHKKKHRISLRYMPADATFFNNERNVDRVVEVKGLNTGDALSKGGEYFPQVWPYRLEEEATKKVLPDKGFTLGQVLKFSLIKATQKRHDD